MPNLLFIGVSIWEDDRPSEWCYILRGAANRIKQETEKFE